MKIRGIFLLFFFTGSIVAADFDYSKMGLGYHQIRLSSWPGCPSCSQPGGIYQYRVVAVGENGRRKPGDSPVAEGFALDQFNQLLTQVLGLQPTLVIGRRPRVSLSWQKVDLAKVSFAQRGKDIKLNFERVKRSDCCKDRLNRAVVYIDNRRVGYIKECKERHRFFVKKRARVVKVQLETTNYLHIKELQVFGHD